MFNRLISRIPPDLKIWVSIGLAMLLGALVQATFGVLPTPPAGDPVLVEAEGKQWLCVSEDGVPKSLKFTH